MEYTELSDLEEGEILEYECCSPSNSSFEEKKDFAFKCIGEKYQRRNLEKNSEPQDIKISVFNFSKGDNGYVNEDIHEKFKASKVETSTKQSLLHKDLRLDSISSSEGEYRSDEIGIENKSVKTYRNKRTYKERSKDKRSDRKTYGTVEDIMSEIGETICRKSRCNYKKRRTKKQCNDSDYQKIFSSRSSKKHGKRRKSTSDSDLEILIEKNLRKGILKSERSGFKKKKKREMYYQSEATNEESTGPEKKIRDFDEVRKYLLEKLKKQKEEETKKMCNLEKSETLNHERLTDCSNCSNDAAKESRSVLCEPFPENDEDEEMDLKSTNYVDSPGKSNGMVYEGVSAENDQVEELGSEKSNHVEKPEEAKTSPEYDEDDEIDIIKLRKVALASHRQRCKSRISPKTENATESTEDKLGKNDDTDLDRNELLLRAEALKTALLKKHQKRLKKLKEEKTTYVESCNDDSFYPSSPEILDVDNFRKATFRCEGGNTLDADSFKENVSNEAKFKSHNEVEVCKQTEEQSSKNAAVPPSTNTKKSVLKVKKKKRKSVSVITDVKENEKKEVGEEDDIMLRSQLLCDLIKKKSLKKLEKKSVLLESIQTSENKPLTTVKYKPELVVNPQPAHQNKLKSINLPKRKTVKNLPKIPKPEIQRIIIHLGPDDSSDEEPGQSPSDSSPVKEDKAEEQRVTNPSTVSKETGESLQARYERSVEMLLSEARRKIEGEKEKSKNSHLATPEAVYKHLPPSQRLEYIKLKQKIAERERLRKVELGVLNKPKNTSLEIPDQTRSTGAVTASTGTKPAEIIGFKPYSDYQKGLIVANTSTSSKLGNVDNTVVNESHGVNPLSPNAKPFARNSGIPKPSPSGTVSEKQILISKLKLLLKKIKIEKTIEENYEKEIRKLKSQMTLLEKKKIEQRIKIKKLWEESMKIYKVTQPSGNGIRTEVKNIEDKKAKEKKEVKEKNTNERVEKKAETQEKEKPELENPNPETTEVAEKAKINRIEMEEDKKKESQCQSEKKAPSSSITDLTIYNSPLQVFAKAPGSSERVDPNVIMCQFDLMGVCKDDECTYQHLRTS